MQMLDLNKKQNDLSSFVSPPHWFDFLWCSFFGSLCSDPFFLPMDDASSSFI